MPIVAFGSFHSSVFIVVVVEHTVIEYMPSFFCHRPSVESMANAPEHWHAADNIINLKPVFSRLADRRAMDVLVSLILVLADVRGCCDSADAEI